jgi:hypothetical protein
MSIRKELINLTIINNSNSNFTIPLFQNGVASINSTIKYSYDITSASLACGQGDIIINGVVYNFTYQPNVSAAVTALTNLGFGFFSYEIIGLNTYIYVVDNTNVYGDMNLCLLVPTTSTTTTTTTPIPTTTTTTSTTTTTTTASLLYLTDQYVCGTCTLLANNVIVGSNFSLDILDYFLGDDGNVYQILGFTTGVPVTTISDNTAYASCVGIPCLTTTTSTTTTTTTPIPTTTTTTSTTTTTTTATPTTTSTTTTTTTILPYNIFLDMSLSVDTTISQITVQGNPVTYVGGATLPNTGGSNSNLNTTDVGGSQNLVITYSCTFSGHKITLTDSLGTITCQNTGVGTNITMSFPTTNISNISLVTILVEDGTC